jgi:hypothetical protein
MCVWCNIFLLLVLTRSKFCSIFIFFYFWFLLFLDTKRAIQNVSNLLAGTNVRPNASNFVGSERYTIEQHIILVLDRKSIKVSTALYTDSFQFWYEEPEWTESYSITLTRMLYTRIWQNAKAEKKHRKTKDWKR